LRRRFQAQAFQPLASPPSPSARVEPSFSRGERQPFLSAALRSASAWVLGTHDALATINEDLFAGQADQRSCVTGGPPKQNKKSFYRAS